LLRAIVVVGDDGRWSDASWGILASMLVSSSIGLKTYFLLRVTKINKIT